jgi:hypothetical protein
MQSSRFHPAGKIRPARLSLINFRKPGKPRIALTDYRAKITQAGIVPKRVRLEKPVAPPLTDCHPPESTSITLPDFVPNLLLFPVLFPDFQCLELAKGFEPPTP